MINFIRLKDIRENNDINQDDIANILNVPRSTYSMWEIGISIIPLKSLVTFSDYFNVSLDYALGLTNDKNNKNTIKGIDLTVLGNNMKSIRKKHNHSQKNISELLKVNQSCVSKYENGSIQIPIDNLYTFCKKYNVSINEICGKNKK